jgi:hypothetical protein
MSASKEAVSIIENLAYKIHEAERHYHELKLQEEDNEELWNFFEGIKVQIGRFFLKHVDRRAKTRPTANIELDYKSYWGFESHKTTTTASDTAVIASCRFCGSTDIKERRNHSTADIHWYCNICHQENRIRENKKKTFS